jgi:hypothetical protein
MSEASSFRISPSTGAAEASKPNGTVFFLSGF